MTAPIPWPPTPTEELTSLRAEIARLTSALEAERNIEASERRSMLQMAKELNEAREYAVVLRSGLTLMEGERDEARAAPSPSRPSRMASRKAR